ncbi:cysteine--tRNA ligase [Candidatus Bathyarchaeota archaeon]|nr:cysteine--tRNA ligase [Candidatus Bathyarchaeota archaeon]
MKIFNTMGMKKEDFIPLREGEVRIYACGPTVYDFIHIGNARAFVVADTIRRYLEHRGFKVFFISNITDIDDKMIKRSQETGLSIQQLGEIFSDAYFEDIAALNIKKPDVSPRATQHIPEMIEVIRKLMEAGYAYQVDGDVYFDVSRFEDYGKLSGNKTEALEMGARIEVNPKKRNPADFALWKARKEGEPGWHSPWGEGRPGWHIECSTMAMKYLGETFDIHMGGKDLIFPHHENEIAQAEALTGKTFARYWIHNEWLTVEGQKMSKSLGNFITVKDALKICSPQVLRFFLISAHYRSPIDFNRESLKLAEANLERINSAMERLQGLRERANRTSEEENLLSEVRDARSKFEEAMDDDFNTPLAIAAIFNAVKAINSYADKNAEIEALTKREVYETVKDLMGILGINIETRREEYAEEKTTIINELINLIIDVRQEMRRRKEWKISDEIRERLQKIGLTIEDSPQGTRWKLKKIQDLNKFSKHF